MVGKMIGGLLIDLVMYYIRWRILVYALIVFEKVLSTLNYTE